MKRFILTGTPGAGKTAIIRQLELDGFSVVEEAATDVIALAQARGIAKPWEDPSFINTVVELQRARQIRASRQPDEVQFHDRSVVCTAALSTYLGYSTSDVLAREVRRIISESVYQEQVLFVRSLGYVTPSAARKISYEEAQRFERIHEETYRSLGFQLLCIDTGGVSTRVAAVKVAVEPFVRSGARP